MAAIKTSMTLTIYTKLPTNHNFPQMKGQNSRDYLNYYYLTYHVNLTKHAKDDILIQS